MLTADIRIEGAPLGVVTIVNKTARQVENHNESVRQKYYKNGVQLLVNFESQLKTVPEVCTYTVEYYNMSKSSIKKVEVEHAGEDGAEVLLREAFTAICIIEVDKQTE